jgi:hypothetical protein
LAQFRGLKPTVTVISSLRDDQTGLLKGKMRPLAFLVLDFLRGSPHFHRMKIEALHVGMKVRHPQYGVGMIKSIAEQTAEIRFDDGQRTVAPETADLQPAEAQMQVTGLSQPLKLFVEETTRAAVAALGLEKPDAIVDELATRWQNGKLVIHPSDPTLQTKEVPLDVFFHKIVMMRNNLRVLEQKINAHEKFSEGEKIDMQQYITRCYGSMTTFNLLFRSKEGQFGG